MKKVYPEEMSYKELFITAAFAAMLLTVLGIGEWVTSDSKFLQFIIESVIPMIIIVCAINFVRNTNYRKGYERGRQHERNMQDICANIKNAIDKKSTNE